MYSGSRHSPSRGWTTSTSVLKPFFSAVSTSAVLVPPALQSAMNFAAPASDVATACAIGWSAATATKLAPSSPAPCPDTIAAATQGQIRVRLKYALNGDKVLHVIDRQSKPGCRVYRGVNDLPNVLNGMGIAVVSTSKGVMSDRKAREANVGGELLCVVS